MNSVTEASLAQDAARCDAVDRLSWRDLFPDKRVHPMRSTAFARACLALLVASAALAPPPASAQVDLAPFLKHREFEQMSLSPTGEYLAATIPLEDSTGLVVMTRANKKVIGKLSLGKNRYIAGFQWVNPTRVLTTVAEQFGSLDQPQITGELYAVDADGSAPRLLVGTRAQGGGAGSRIGQTENVFARLADDLPHDDKRVLVAVSPWGSDTYTRLESMDVYSGRRLPVTRAPVRNAGFAIDHAGVARFAVGADRDRAGKLYERKVADAEWTLVNDEATSGHSEGVIGFSADDRLAYLLVEQDKGPDAVVEYEIATGKRREVLRDATFDPARVRWSLRGDTPVGAAFRGAESRNAFFDEDGREARLYRSLEASFPGQRVSLVSATQDGKLALVLLDGPDNPGDYFLLDVDKTQASYLASKRRWMDPAKMAPTRPVTFTARDGLEMRGFLTTPKGSSGKGLPLVVMPHGGPFGISDWPDFDDDAELLARAGYAVLRVNYRGSGGRGRLFNRQGARQWGGTMQDDLTDATKWAVREGIADGNRMCMYGASYGGYASLMGVAKEPSLYKCAVGYVGVYDLELISSSLSAFATSSRTFAAEWVGPRESLAAVSPSKLAGNIKVPVFLAAGLQDTRATPEHTQRMEKALRAAGVPVEAMYAQGEGHGFYTDANRREFYTRLLAFLSKNLGGQVAK
jgi:dipeptidyl aminopeptidase/acylaminoacyl peptidase